MNSNNKIQSRETLTQLSAKFRAEGKVVGFTSGAFDILHAGHVDYLEKAKQQCDVLIVGVNTDKSVISYKGKDRPILSEEQRIRVVAALASVDWAFLFNERRNRKNIEALKPHLYIKAGDYVKEELTSKELVEGYGGSVVLIPVSVNVSTSAIIQKIRSSGEKEERVVEYKTTAHIQRVPNKSRPAVFIDRDGTINEDIGYLHEPSKFRLLPKVLEGIKKFQNMGYRIIILTNQGGIGLGYFTKEDFFKVSGEMLHQFSKAGILIDKIYFCPHCLAEKCTCRKPETGLLQLAREQLNIDLEHSILIGDRTADIETAKRAGCTSILVNTGFAGQDGEYEAVADYTVNNLLEAAEVILAREEEFEG